MGIRCSELPNKEIEIMRLFLVFFSVVVLCSCASKPESFADDIQLDINKYLKYKTKKAYALAIDENGAWASGFGYGYSSQERANKRAIAECEKQKAMRKIKPKCGIHMQGNAKIGI